MATGNWTDPNCGQLQLVVHSFAVGFSSVSVIFSVQWTGPANTTPRSLCDDLYLYPSETCTRNMSQGNLQVWVRVYMGFHGLKTHKGYIQGSWATSIPCKCKAHVNWHGNSSCKVMFLVLSLWLEVRLVMLLSSHIVVVLCRCHPILLLSHIVVVPISHGHGQLSLRRGNVAVAAILCLVVVGC